MERFHILKSHRNPNAERYKKLNLFIQKYIIGDKRHTTIKSLINHNGPLIGLLPSIA